MQGRGKQTRHRPADAVDLCAVVEQQGLKVRETLLPSTGLLETRACLQIQAKY